MTTHILIPVKTSRSECVWLKKEETLKEGLFKVLTNPKSWKHQPYTGRITESYFSNFRMENMFRCVKTFSIVSGERSWFDINFKIQVARLSYPSSTSNIEKCILPICFILSTIRISSFPWLSCKTIPPLWHDTNIHLDILKKNYLSVQINELFQWFWGEFIY